MTQNQTGCCERFEPGPWDEKEMTWEGKKFVKDRIRSFLHIPLNFGAVMKRNMERIQKAGAIPDEMVWLTDENSLWGADLYLSVSKDVPGATMAELSGTFLAKVFEGPYNNVRTWIGEMQAHVIAKGKDLKKLYFFYTTCPKCAKVYGKNYVVLLAQV
ncbi:MAG: hydrolase [Planctomycetota bacterium]